MASKTYATWILGFATCALAGIVLFTAYQLLQLPLAAVGTATAFFVGLVVVPYLIGRGVIEVLELCS